MISLYVFLLYGLVASANVIKAVDKSTCGQWSEWTGDCEYDRCGICKTQERVREPSANCTGELKQLRHCKNFACSFPCFACSQGCERSFLGGGWPHYRLFNQIAQDGRPPSRLGYPMKECRRVNNTNVHFTEVKENQECGLWSEWTGDCEYDRCGLCNIQERVREQKPKCKGKSKELRHCLNAPCYFPCNSCAEGCASGAKLTHHCKSNSIIAADDHRPIVPRGLKMKTCAMENKKLVHH